MSTFSLLAKMPLSSLKTAWHRVSWDEVSGAAGDLGTFLPLLVAATQAVGLDLGTTLIFTGLFNVATGVLFDLPLPVQPMKAIVALAIASPDTVGLPEVMAAGMFVGLLVLLLGATGGISLVNAAVPRPVVGGMQLAMGLELAQKGMRLIWYRGGGGGGAVRPVWGADSLALGIGSAVYVLLSVYAPRTGGSGGGSGRGSVAGSSGGRTAGGGGGGGCGRDGHGGGSRPRSPAALVLVVAGTIVACIANPEVLRSLRLGPTLPHVLVPTWEQLKRGVALAGLPQLPLTTLNSVVAVADWASSRFPERRPMSTRKLCLTLGAFNVIGGMLGSLPACNGVGGLAAQTAFGARSGAAPVVLGAAKLALGLLFGSSMLLLLDHLPGSVLGAMLVVAGVELAGCCRSYTAGNAGGAGGGGEAAPGAGAGGLLHADGGGAAAGSFEAWEWMLLAVTAALCNVSKNVALGVSGGVVCSVVVRLPGWVLRLQRGGGEAVAAEHTHSDGGGGGRGGGREERQTLLPA